MPLTQMPNGEYVDIADGTPPEVVERIKSQFKAKPKAASPARAPANRVVASIDQKAREQAVAEHYTPKIFGMSPRMVNSATFGLADKAKAAFSSVGDAITGKSSLSDAYSQNREAGRQVRATEEEDKPWQSNFEDIAGAFLTPLGAETGVAKVVGRFAPNTLKALQGSRVGRAVASMGNTSVGLGARTGVNAGVIQGAANSLDNPEQSLLDGAANGGITGGGAGALFGGGIGAIGKVGQVLADRMPENAKRVAYSKMADFLSRSHNPSTGKPFSPASTVNEIKAADKAGGDAMVMDVMPEMRNMAGYLSRKPGFKQASELEARASARTTAAPDRFDNTVRRTLGIRGEVDGFAKAESISAKRKAQGADDYAEGGAMDKPLKWSNELDSFFREAPPATEVALKSAYMERLNRREMPATLHQGPDGTFTHVPDLRTLDYVKRAFDNGIGQALRGGDRSTAQALSKELSTLRELVGKSNPEYKEILARQRDAFQKEETLRLGMDALKRLKSNPRELYRDMRKGNIDREMLKLGFADALFRLREKGDNPVRLMRAMMRSGPQRKVLQDIFGDNKTLNQFDKFIRREVRSLESDAMVISNRQSATHTLKAMEQGDEMESAADLGKATLQGLAFGGKVGALSRGIRAVDMLSSGIGNHAQEELARILMGKGKGLAEGTAAAKKFALEREKRRGRRSEAAGRVGASLFVPEATE